MTPADLGDALARGDLGFLDEDQLTDWVLRQRWYGAKARGSGQLQVLETVPLRTETPVVIAAFVESRFQAGTHELYQLLLGARASEQAGENGVIARGDGWVVFDALADSAAGGVLAGLLERSVALEMPGAGMRFHWVDGTLPLGDDPAVRPIGAEQSNSSIVFDERLVLKVFRRLEPGDNPELEMLRFLTEHEFPNIPALAGWYEYAGDLMDATLGVLQEFVVDGRDGWELALDQIVAGSPAFLGDLRDLGEVTGRMHTALASDGVDPDFAPEEPSAESLSLLTATIDEQIERLFIDLPDEHEALAPIAGRGEEVRDRLQMLSHVGVGGRLIRTHGDYHLGQTLRAPDRWVVLDFEGEPMKPLFERRRKRSPLRDVAGMLHSFGYAHSAAGMLRGSPPHEGWEQQARTEFLEGYLATADLNLLPAGRQAIGKLLSIFELEKAVYQLRYELNNRPDWVGIQVAGLARLLEEPLQ